MSASGGKASDTAQQRLAQLMGLAGGSQKYIDAIRTALVQAQAVIDSLPQLATMLRDTDLDMRSFMKQVSMLNPNAGDKSTRILKALKRSSVSNVTHGVFGKMKQAAAGTVTAIKIKASAIKKRLQDPAKLLPSLISQLPKDNVSFAAWQDSVASGAKTLFSKGYLFDQLIDLALSIVPMRTQITCACDPEEHGEFTQISAEGVLDEQDPQRVWFHSADSTAVVYGFTIRHLVCCDAATVAADESAAAATAAFVANEDMSAAQDYDAARGQSFLFLVVISILAVVGIVLAEKDERGWHMPTPVNFLIARSNTRLVAFAVGSISVFMFDFVFGLLFPNLFDSEIQLPTPTSSKLSIFVKFFWCIVMSLLLTPLPSALQSRNKMAGAVIGALLSLASKLHIIPSLLFFQNGAKNRDVRCVLRPSPQGSG